jgi:hypothetical protein
LHIAHPGFFLFHLEKVFRDLKRYKNPGLGIKSPTPTPQSWKHPGNLAKSRKSPGNLGNYFVSAGFSK